MSALFPCDKCGKCCENLNKSPLYSDLNDGTGKCIHYDRGTKFCRIYEHRPEKCNIIASYKYFKDKYSFEEYVQINIDSCRKLKEE